MDKLEKAARSIVEEGRDLYEVSIEERIEPIYLRHMVAVLTGDSCQDELAEEIRRLEENRRQLEDELSRLRSNVKIE